MPSSSFAQSSLSTEVRFYLFLPRQFSLQSPMGGSLLGGRCTTHRHTNDTHRTHDTHDTLKHTHAHKSHIRNTHTYTHITTPPPSLPPYLPHSRLLTCLGCRSQMKLAQMSTWTRRVFPFMIARKEQACRIQTCIHLSRHGSILCSVRTPVPIFINREQDAESKMELWVAFRTWWSRAIIASLARPLFSLVFRGSFF